MSELYEEAGSWREGNKKADFYKNAIEVAAKEKIRNEGLLKIVSPKDMPWEDSPQGKIKWIVNEGMNVRLKTMDLYLQELPPGGRSGRHRHWSEEFVYVLEGQGYDVHWDMELETRERPYWSPSKKYTRWDWKKDDAICIPVNTVHQHFNSDPKKPARFLSATSRIYRHMGYSEIDQILSHKDDPILTSATADSKEASTKRDRLKSNVAKAERQGWDGQMKEMAKIKSLPRIIKAEDHRFPPNKYGTVGITTKIPSPYPDENIPLSTFKCWLYRGSPKHVQKEGIVEGHSHLFEAVFYILNGEGYEIHDNIKYPWKAGDAVVVHTNCTHAHFGASGTTPIALVITAKALYCRVNLKEEQIPFL